MSRRAVWAPVVLAFACLALASCGSEGGGSDQSAGDEAAVATVAERYLKALGDLDAAGVCDSLTAAAQQQVVAQSGSSEKRCVDVFRLGFATMSEEQKRILADQSTLEPFGIDVRGTTATGRLQYNSQTSTFAAEKVGGGWKLSSPGEAEIVPRR